MRRTLGTLSVLLSLAVIPVAAQETHTSAPTRRPMTFDDVIALRSVNDAQISPDGKWVAYTVTRADLEQNAADADIWLTSTAGEFPSRLTTNKKSDTSPRWSPDGKRLAFISAREEKPQLFVMSPFGGEPERLTENKGGVRALAWMLVAGAVLVIGLGATATLVLIRANTDTIPKVTDISAKTSGDAVTFTWRADAGLGPNDLYQITTSDGGSSIQTAAAYRVDAKAGDRVCITVTVNREGKTGESSGEKCVDFGA